jgi:hypothetical protein
MDEFEQQPQSPQLPPNTSATVEIPVLAIVVNVEYSLKLDQLT